MKRTLWGEFETESKRRRHVKPGEIIRPQAKLDHLRQMQSANVLPERSPKRVSCDNPLVTQTVEASRHTEALRNILDPTLNGNQNAMGSVDLSQVPQECTADIITVEKVFKKPMWFIPPTTTSFTRGLPQVAPTISKRTVNQGLRKSLSGLLLLKRFKEANDSALSAFVDGVDEYLQSFMDRLRLAVDDKQVLLDVNVLEKVYQQTHHTSLLSLHNYYRDEILLKNRKEKNDLKAASAEYESLQRSHNRFDEFTNLVDYVTSDDYKIVPNS